MKVLITGAAGGVGSYVRPLLREHYDLVLADITAIDELHERESFVPCDIGSKDQLEHAMKDVGAIVHLAGVPVEDSWEPILKANIEGCYNVFEIAHKVGVKRLVFASSNHALGFYPRNQTIGVEASVRPDSRYGVSKAFGEALGALYGCKYGLSVLAIRIGNVAPEPVDLRRLAIWISPRDLAQLMRIGIDNDLGYEIVYGMSDNARAWWDNSNASRLGYRPADRSEDYAERVLAAEPARDPEANSQRFQGGDFVDVERGGGRAPQQ